MRNLVGAVLIVLGFSMASAIRAAVVEWPESEGGNGHFYEVVLFRGTWDIARNLAVNRGGYLATITSKEEDEFVISLIQDPAYWHYVGSVALVTMRRKKQP